MAGTIMRGLLISMLFAVMITDGPVLATVLRTDFTDAFKSGMKAGWGDWGAFDWCPEGSWAMGFNLKVDHSQGQGDGTAVNGIRLYCRLVRFLHDELVKQNRHPENNLYRFTVYR